MNILLVPLLCASLLPTFAAPPPPASDTLSLAGTWQLLLDTTSTLRTQSRAGEVFTDTVHLPGTLDENGKGFANRDTTDQRLNRLYEYTGPAWYRRTITVPERWAGKHVELLLERTKVTRLWLDGKEIGSRQNLFTPQLYDLTGLARPGTHTITVVVDNDPALVPVEGSHAYSENTQTNWNGIIGKMQLIASSPTRLERVRVFPDLAARSARIEVQIAGGEQRARPLRLKISASSWNTDKAYHAGELSVGVTPGAADAPFSVLYDLGQDAPLWSEFDPALFRLSVALLDGNELLDQQETTFGLRRFATSGTQFTINGETTFLRGKHDAAVFPLTGYPPMDTASWGRVFRIARSYGINHYRFHSWTPPEAAFLAADVAGIYLQPELPIWYGFKADDPDQMQFMMDEGTQILDSYGNHASFVMFALGNEISQERALLKGTVDRFRAHDPRPLYAQGSNNRLWDASYAEGDDFWVTFRTGSEQPDFSTDVRASISHLDSEEGGILNTRYPSTRWNYADAIRRSPVPVVGHEIGEYSIYPNFGEMTKYTGVLQPWNFATFRSALARKGMLDEADRFFRASGALAVLSYRAEIEGALRTPGFGGFQLLDLQDYPGQGTALVGILDAFMDSKGLIEPEDFRQFNGPVVLLLLMDRYTWTRDELFQADIQIANYGPAALPDAGVRWELLSGDGPVASGVVDGKMVAQGALQTLGSISADLSSGRGAERLTMRLTLEGTEVQTEYPVWVYPAEPSTAIPPGVKVVRHLDREAMQSLEGGARMLLLPEPGSVDSNAVGGQFIPEFWNYGMFRQLAFQYGDGAPDVSPGTMGLLMDPAHPIFKTFPTEFHSDWQWWSIVKASRPVILDATDAAYRPLVQTIDNVNRNHKLGLIFEFRVGEGRLLVASTDLPSLQQSPEARALYAALLRYAASSDFAPATSITPAALLDLLYGTGRQLNEDDPDRPRQGYTEY